jgi:excinuclease UvrABC ATPase subunit
MFDPVNKILGRRPLRDRYSYNKDEPVKEINAEIKSKSPLLIYDPYGYKTRRNISFDKEERERMKELKNKKYIERQKENQRKWREAHPGIYAEYNRTWRQNHPEQWRKYKQKWYKEHPLTPQQKERAKETQRRWRAANPEKVRENVQRWQKANPEKVRALQRIIMRRYRKKLKGNINNQ